MLEDEEYWDEARTEVLGSTAEDAADDLVSLSYLSLSSDVLSWDSSSWILALAVLNLSSNSFSLFELALLARELPDLSLSSSWTSLSLSCLKAIRVLSVSTPENSTLILAFSIS